MSAALWVKIVVKADPDEWAAEHGLDATDVEAVREHLADWAQRQLAANDEGGALLEVRR